MLLSCVSATGRHHLRVVPPQVHLAVVRQRGERGRQRPRERPRRRHPLAQVRRSPLPARRKDERSGRRGFNFDLYFMHIYLTLNNTEEQTLSNFTNGFLLEQLHELPEP